MRGPGLTRHHSGAAPVAELTRRRPEWLARYYELPEVGNVHNRAPAARSAADEIEDAAARAAGYARAAQVPTPELPRLVAKFLDTTEGRALYRRHVPEVA